MHSAAAKLLQSCLTLCDPHELYSLPGTSVHGDCPGKNTGVDCLALLQRIFPTQRLNPGLPYCKQILYYLSHQGSPGILEWVAYPFSRGTPRPRNQTRVFCIAGRFFTIWATREAPWLCYWSLNCMHQFFHLQNGANGGSYTLGQLWVVPETCR